MKYIVSVLVVLMLISGCSSPQISSDDIQSTIKAGIEQTQASIPTDIPTENPTNTLVPTNTPRPTSIPKPTNTIAPTQAPTEVPAQGIAKNYVASDEDAGVVVEVVRVLIAPKESVSQNFATSEIYNDKSTLVEFIFRITNNTNEVITFNFFTNTASVNGEQISFQDYAWAGGSIGDNLSDKVLPGSYVIGGYWTGIKRSTWEEANKIVISIDHAFDSNYSRVTKDFLFTIDVVDWSFEPLPDDLK